MTYYVNYNGKRWGIKQKGNNFSLTDSPGDTHAIYYQDIVDWLASENLRREGKTLDL